jgi:hypothetical protein
MREKPMVSILLSKSDHLPLPQKPETDSISSQVQIITMMSITEDCRGKVRRLKQMPLQRLLPQQHALCLVAELDATDKFRKRWSTIMLGELSFDISACQ